MTYTDKITTEDNGGVTANFEATALESMSAVPVHVIYSNVGSHNLLTLRRLAGEDKGEMIHFIVDGGDLYQVSDSTARVMTAAALSSAAGE